MRHLGQMKAWLKHSYLLAVALIGVMQVSESRADFFAYVTNAESDIVSRIVTATGAVDQTINVGDGPTGVTVTSDEQYVYVGNFEGDNVSRIVTATGAVDQTINVGDGPFDVAVTPDGQYVYVTNWGDATVSRIVVATGIVDQTINMGNRPYGLAVSPDGQYVYVANWGGFAVSRIVVGAGTVDQTINMGSRPYHLAFISSPISPPGENGPSPDQIPPGGPPHQLGGGGDNIGMPLPPGHIRQPNGQGGTPQDLTMALGNTGGTMGVALSPENDEIQIPGFIYSITGPSGNKEDCWLALGESGVMPNGVEYSTQIRWNYEVRVIDLKATWPWSVIQGMTPGRHLLSYCLQTEDGRRSNCRFEYLDCGPDPGSAVFLHRKSAAVGRNTRELLFKLQVSYFDKQTGLVERIKEGMCEIEVDGEVRDTFPIVGGMLTVIVPFGVTSKIKFTSQVFNGTKTVRIEFKDGFVYAYDHDYRDAAVEVYKYPEEEAYAIEYYRNGVYICNQGPDLNGPILGRMFRGGR